MIRALRPIPSGNNGAPDLSGRNARSRGGFPNSKGFYCVRDSSRLKPALPSKGGSVLLEVVLAMVLFVAAATIISSGLNSSIQAVHRLRQDTHAQNLAISLLSEMQMHARPVQTAGPEPFEPPFEQWTWKIDVLQLEESTLEVDAMRKVEVTIRHNEDNVVHRLAQFMRAGDGLSNETSAAQSPGGF